MKDRNTARFFDASDDLNLAEFTPAFFEQFLVYKRDMAKSATLTEYRSAIKDLCRLKRIVLPVEYGDDMKQLYSGIKRLEAEQNQSSSPKNSNKQPLTFSLYKELCNLSRFKLSRRGTRQRSANVESLMESLQDA
ncbi:hypothetical protein PC113_g2670 [Phytophthora cactorum]|uniref:Core-binding (CB) domain-containing protein n=1 Tax=Phytophthora cactorum TaxID=29920 RepID=A0A8T0ZTB5_9STRA|nr:hypothetical protein PC113_g2670 [Phytophthora cactorum]KAG2952429.1 hypothetical protein PC117_g2799 [Phytophthora cactorum]